MNCKRTKPACGSMRKVKKEVFTPEFLSCESDTDTYKHNENFHPPQNFKVGDHLWVHAARKRERTAVYGGITGRASQGCKAVPNARLSAVQPIHRRHISTSITAANRQNSGRTLCSQNPYCAISRPGLLTILDQLSARPGCQRTYSTIVPPNTLHEAPPLQKGPRLFTELARIQNTNVQRSSQSQVGNTQKARSDKDSPIGPENEIDSVVEIVIPQAPVENWSSPRSSPLVETSAAPKSNSNSRVAATAGTRGARSLKNVYNSTCRPQPQSQTTDPLPSGKTEDPAPKAISSKTLQRRLQSHKIHERNSGQPFGRTRIGSGHLKKETIDSLKEIIARRGSTKTWRMNQLISHMATKEKAQDLLGNYTSALNATSAVCSSPAMAKSRRIASLSQQESVADACCGALSTPENSVGRFPKPEILSNELPRLPNSSLEEASFQENSEKQDESQPQCTESQLLESTASQRDRRRGSTPVWMLTPSQQQLLFNLHTGLTPRPSLEPESSSAAKTNQARTSTLSGLKQVNSQGSKTSRKAKGNSRFEELDTPEEWDHDGLLAPVERTLGVQRYIEKFRKKSSSKKPARKVPSTNPSRGAGPKEPFVRNDGEVERILEKGKAAKARQAEGDRIADLRYIAQNSVDESERQNAIDELSELLSQDDEEI